MGKYTCQECGEEFSKSQLDKELFLEGEYYCINCAVFLIESARDAVDPDHNFTSYADWDENGR